MSFLTDFDEHVHANLLIISLMFSAWCSCLQPSWLTSETILDSKSFSFTLRLGLGLFLPKLLTCSSQWPRGPRVAETCPSLLLDEPARVGVPEEALFHVQGAWLWFRGLTLGHISDL